MKTQVTEKALLGRVNYTLARKGKRMKKRSPHSWNSRWCPDLGDYYIVETCHDVIIASQSNLEEIAREMGCLADGEELVTQPLLM